VLFGGEHEDGEAEGGGDEHLDEDALRRIDARAEHGAGGGKFVSVKFVAQSLGKSERGRERRKEISRVLRSGRAWGEREDKRSGSDAACELCNTVEHEAQGRDDPAEDERERDVRVEDRAGDAEEEPGRDEQREAAARGDVEVHLDLVARAGVLGGDGLDGAEEEEEEGGRADVFERGGLQVRRERGAVCESAAHGVRERGGEGEGSREVPVLYVRRVALNYTGAAGTAGDV
jgi:hypothetical protein